MGQDILSGARQRRFFRSGKAWIAALLCGLVMLAGAPPGHAARWAGLTATVFHNYGRDQGLPHPVPTALVQDREGFLWIGTQGGLARWDGYRFHAYRADPMVPGSLPDDWVQTLHVDSAGRLWVGAGAGGLALYDAGRDRFVRAPLGRLGERVHIGAIADDGTGGLWIGSDKGLHHLISATGAISRVPDGRPAAPVRALLRDRTGALWVGTTKGLARRSPRSGRFEPVTLDGEATSVSALFEDRQGRIWVGTVRRGLFVIDRPSAIPRPIGTETILATGSVSTISAADGREIWAGLRGNGIVAIDAATGRTRIIRHDRTVPSSLAHNDIWAILRDRAGSLWVGSTGGLSYHARNPGPVSTIIASQQQPGGLSASDPLAVLATRDGRVWLGYLDGGVDVLDPLLGRVAALRPGPSGGERWLPPDIVFAMAEGEDGDVYIGTRRGLYRTGRSGAGVRRITIPGRDPQEAVTALAFDAGTLWVGSDEDGLTGMIPGRNGGAERIVFGPGEARKLNDGGINTIRRGKGNDLWIGARNGLYRIDLVTRAVEHIVADPADRAALPARFVVALLIDRQGRLWVGTFGGGLAMMTGREATGRPRFRRFGLVNGLPHVNLDGLEMDGTGMIWAGTDEGLARIDPADLSIRAVRQADGSSLIDYFAGAGTASPAGEALFGAKGGLTIVRPGPLPRWTLQPPLVVTDLRIGGVSVPVSRFNRHPPMAPIRLTPETNSIAVEFAALDFTAPERNRYAYRLEGFDRNWTETDASRRLAIYTNLPPGDYTLRLRGSNRAGIWAPTELALPIQVIPAWYQRLWFKLAIAAALLLAIVAIVRWRTRYLRRRQSALERQIADRTADLRSANERLGHLAMTDPLTGCANRRHFMALAEHLANTAHGEGTPLALAILDLDDFKRTNDRHGHPGGDAILSTIGDIIRHHGRPEDFAGRIGGEEFALLMPNTGLEEGWQIAERLREAIAATTIHDDDKVMTVTASIGVAELRKNEGFSRLYARADAALYAAKGGGRNRVEAAPPED